MKENDIITKQFKKLGPIDIEKLLKTSKLRVKIDNLLDFKKNLPFIDQEIYDNGFDKG